MASLKEELEQIERRDLLLQERYTELELEGVRSSETRVGVLEERLMDG